jgi:hypothetical protein
MLDTVQFKIFDASVEEIETVHRSLREKSSKFFSTDDYFKGSLNSLQVNKNDGNTISVSGSLSAYHHGNNFKTLNYNELKTAILNLEEQLGISLDEAKLVRLDICSMVETKSEPNAYYNSLVSYPHKRRHPEDNGIYFGGKSEKILIYDKGKKTKTEDGNEYFRYEHKLKNNKLIKTKLKIERVIDLKSAEIFNRLVKFWFDSYTSIHKTEKEYDKSKIDSVSALRQFLYALGVDALGGVAPTLAMVNELRFKGSINTDIAYKCRKAITEHYDGPVGIINNEFVIELNEAFKTEYDRLLVPTEIRADL